MLIRGNETSQKFPLLTLFAWLVITFGLMAFGGSNILKNYDETTKSWEESFLIQQICKDIIYLDEVLTMSARLAAYSGETFWEKRYQENEKKLSELINTLKKTGSKKIILSFAKETEEANNALVDMETQAFSLIRQGKVDNARQIFNSKNYETQKNIYSNGIFRLINELEENNRNNINDHNNRLITVSLTFGVFMLVGWAFVLFLLNNYFTKQKLAENSFKKTKEELSLILNNVGKGILGLKSNGKINFANPHAQALLGYSLKELQNDFQHGLFHQPPSNEDSYPEEKCQKCKFIREGKTKHISDETFWTKDGKPFPVDITIVPVYENGIHSGSVMTFDDISEQKQHESDLIQSKKDLEKADLAKSEFLARTSHELRTPMNAILGFTQLLEMDTQNPLTQSQRENLERISSAGDQLLDLINKTLDLSRIETGKMSILVETVDLIPIIEEAVSQSTPAAIEKKIAIEFQGSRRGSCFVRVNAERLNQIIRHLISNAIKFNKPEGSVIIFLEDQSPNKIRLSIQDTGPGISEEKKESIFKPFERINAHEESIEGAGIGLTLSKHFIEMMDGSLGFESKWGEGSLFYLDIPMPSLQSSNQSNRFQTENRGLQEKIV